MLRSECGLSRFTISLLLLSFFLMLAPDEAEARRRFFGPRRAGPRGVMFRRGGPGARRMFARGRGPRRFVGQPRISRGRGRIMQRLVLGRDNIGNDILSQNLVRDEFGNVFVVNNNFGTSALSSAQAVVDPAAISDQLLVGRDGRLLTGVGVRGGLLSESVNGDVQAFNSQSCVFGGFCSNSGF